MTVIAMRDNTNEDTATEPTIEDIFEHWKRLLSTERARLDDKRRLAIKARIKDGYSPTDLLDAISGCFLSPWHALGDNPRGTKCCDITLICRDAEHIDRFLELYDKGQEAMRRARIEVPKPQQQIASAEDARKHLEAIRKIMR